MRRIVDTHTFLWALMQPEKLSSRAAEVLEERSDEVFLSVMSFWEISLKFSLGKLRLEGLTPSDMPRAAQTLGLSILALEFEDASTFHLLAKTTHKDPFDRMIIWQSIRRQWPVISDDRAFQLYKPHGLILLE